MPEIGEKSLVSSNQKKRGRKGKDGKREKHEEVTIRIVDIKDAKGTSIKDGAAEYDPKLNGVKLSRGTISRKTTFIIETAHQKADIMLVVLPKKSNKAVYKHYYNKCFYVFGKHIEKANPQQHVIEWDGRVSFDGDRLILQGEYEVRAVAWCVECRNEVREKTTIKVAKPFAVAFGAKHPRHDLRRPARYVRAKLKQPFPDGTGFRTDGSSTATAKEALKLMRQKSALWYYDGHGSRYGGVIFRDRDGTKSYIRPWITIELREQREYIRRHHPGRVETHPEVEVLKLPKRALDDVFLAVGLACWTGTNFISGNSGDSLITAFKERGVDLSIGFKRPVILRSYQKWTEDFLKYLYSGESIYEAARKAAKAAKIEDPDRLNLKDFVILETNGTKKEEKLCPVRYGRKKR